MAISVVSQGTLVSWPNAFNDLTIGATYQVGDFLLVHIMSNGAMTDYSAPGFTLVSPEIVPNGSGQFFFYKKLTTAGTTIPLTGFKGTGAVNWAIFRGVSSVLASGQSTVSGINIPAFSTPTFVICYKNGNASTWTTDEWTIHSNNWGTSSYTFAWKSFPDLIFIPPSTLWNKGLPYIVLSDNAYPSSTVYVDNLITYNKNVKLLGTITELDGDFITYRISKNGTVYRDWTDLQTSPLSLSVDLGALQAGVNTILVDVSDNKHAYTTGEYNTTTFTVTKKDWEITYLNYSTPTRNYLNDHIKLNQFATVLMKVEYDKNLGYISKGTLKLKIAATSTTVAPIQVGLISSAWDSNTVNYNTCPSLDTEVITFTPSIGTNTFDITSLVQKLATMPNYGIYIKTDSGDMDLEDLGNVVTVDYQITLLDHPKNVYGNRCQISWKSLISNKVSSVQKIELYRDTNTAFSSEVLIYTTTDTTKLSYMDNSITLGTYYYRLKIYFAHATIIINQLDFAVGTESNYVVSDSSKIEFSIGVVQMKLIYAATTKDFDFSDVSEYTLSDTTNSQILSGRFMLRSTEAY